MQTEILKKHETEIDEELLKGHAAQTYFHKLLVLQKRALRLMFFAEPRTHAVPLFLETKQLPISFLLFEQMSLFMYDVHNNLVICRNRIRYHSVRSSLACRKIFEVQRPNFGLP